MTGKRITVLMLILMLCMRTQVCASAADVTRLSAEQIEAAAEVPAVEEDAAEERSIEEQAAEEQAIEDQLTEEQVTEEQVTEEQVAEENLTEEKIIEENFTENKHVEDNPIEDKEDAAEGRADDPEQDFEDQTLKEAETSEDVGSREEHLKDEEDLTEIIESDPAAESEQNTASGAVQTGMWTVKGWHKIGSLTFYVKSDLKLARGITKVGSVKYIFDPVTGELRKGLVTIGGATYLADSSGKMLTGWHTVNKKKYYFTDKHYSEYKAANEGKRLSGFVYVSGHRYYLMNEKMKGFKEANRGVRASGWATVKGYVYYMDPKTGIVATGFKTIDGKRYYFNENGSRQPYTKWREVEGKRYYFNSDHSVQRGMSTIDGRRYYLSSETGEVMCGWKTINGKKYYFADERYKNYDKSTRGHRLTGFCEIAGKTYYFITSSMSGYSKADYASRATGWKTINKKPYYFYADGHRQECGRTVINGKMCAFDVNGVCRSKNSTINDVVQYALKWENKIGYKSSVTGTDSNEERKKELKEGGATDCSWFVFHCLSRYGYVSEFVHSFEWGSKPSKYPGGKEIGRDLSKAKPGDIICYSYGTPRTSKNSHVSIYIGNGREIHCANGHGVIISTVQKKDIYKIVRFSR